MRWGRGRKDWKSSRILSWKTSVRIFWIFLIACCLGEGKIYESEAAGKIPNIRSTLDMAEIDSEDIDLEDLGEAEEEISDEEIEQMLEKYLSRMEDEDPETAGNISSKITDPVIEMKPEGGNFRYILPNGNYFLSSVPNGMITSQAVDLTLPDGTMGLVQKDDASQAFPDSWRFTQKGNYHIKLLILQPPEDMNLDHSIYEVNFYFTIIDRKDNTLGAVFAPEGFSISQVHLDGKQQETGQQEGFFLKGDGYYEIRFESQEQEGVFIDTAFTRDTKAPFLSFSEEIRPEGIAGPLEFYPSEQNCKVYMNYNGSRGYAVSSTLKAAGNYELLVEDSTGNQRSYYVRIRQTYNLVDKRVIVVAAVLLAAGAARLVFLRKNMQVL